jgi:hypothetical protein
MPCDTMRLPDQTMTQRVEEVKKAVTAIDRLIAARKVTVKVGPQGAITFIGISDEDRRRMTDACIYRTLRLKGTAATKMAIQRAEQVAGVKVDRKVVAAGIHSHDNGATWHPKG